MGADSGVGAGVGADSGRGVGAGVGADSGCTDIGTTHLSPALHSETSSCSRCAYVS